MTSWEALSRCRSLALLPLVGLAFAMPETTALRASQASPAVDFESRQNFQLATGLVIPGDPSTSRLLLHPLAEEAGGDPAHTGGKFWQSQNGPEWQALAAWVRGASSPGGGSAAAQAAAAPAPTLDYDFFKTSVQPVFLTKRPGLTRCYVCHALGAGEGNAPAAMHLERLSPGATTWNEEQSRKNFDVVRQKVVPGNPMASRLLIHPLRFEAGGELDHLGGHQFRSANDPEWQAIAAWVKGEKSSAK